MIRLVRSAEPPALAVARAKYLPLARAADVEERSKLLTKGYRDAAVGALFEMQHNKCCYCEKLEEQAKYRDVEHYRPKSVYWWLTWTWENLLFSCLECNRDAKRDSFPLAPGSAPLVAEQVPPGTETPLLIDPTGVGVDPWTEIAFRPVKQHGLERWRPFGVTQRGRVTIEVCGLDRPALLDLYRAHVREVVRPRTAVVIEAASRGDARDVRKLWSRARRSLLGEMSKFRALSRDAMNHIVGARICQEFHLEIGPP
jgi:hypothetical protein